MKAQKIPIFLASSKSSQFLLLICDSYMSSNRRLVPLKLCVGFSILDSVSFSLKLIFLFKKCMDSLTLKVLRNRISRIIRLRSLFCSIRVYVSLHFLPILLENWFFIVLRFLSFLPVMCRI